MLNRTSAVTILVAAIGASGLVPTAFAAGTTPVATTSATQTATDTDAQNKALLAAAEPFEALTETAYAASPTDLKVAITKAEEAALAVTPKLNAIQAKQLQNYIAEIHRGAVANDRVSIAIGAVEGYRTLVTAVQPPVTVPTGVNLLDYAGFRFTADITPAETRWTDAAQAVAFGQQEWSKLAPKVNDTSLANKVKAALTEMQAATASRDLVKAKTAVASELDLVDALEKYFIAHPAS